MSRFDLERFTADVRKNPALADELSRMGNDPQALVRWTAARGYQLTSEEAEGLAYGLRELSDEEQENVAGGWDSGEPQQ